MRSPCNSPVLHPLASRRMCAVVLAAAAAFSIAGAGAETGWPEFRGPAGDGHAASANLPLNWSETENVTWKVPIAHKGWSTPVVLEGRVWLTTATEAGHDFFAICLDAATGEVKFNKKLFHSDNPEPLSNTVNCYASPSAVVEPGRVYISFGSYGTACLDTATFETIWKRSDLPCRHFRGPGSSPILFEDLLILSLDGIETQYVAALDKRTGKTVWKTDRSTVWTDLDEDGLPTRGGDLRKAFCTPIIYEAGGAPRMLTLGSSAAFAYDPYTGKELWRCHLPGHSSSVRPVLGGGRAYVATGYGTTDLWAIRTGGAGDVSDTHVAWTLESRDAPQTPSLLFVDGLLYMVGNQGVATCIDPETGGVLWSERLGGGYIASPLYAGGRIYFFNVQGKTSVVKAGRTFALLAENELDEGFMASPAVSGDTLFLRTKTHLYRIDSKEK